MKRGYPVRGMRLGLCCCMAALILLAPYQASAQLLQGTIDGNVTDATQGAVAGANVTARNQETNFVRETLTNSVGGYSLPGLAPGTYTISVTAQGFQGYSETAIAVTPTPTTESIWLCLDGTVSPGAACTGPNPGLRFNRTTCVRYVQDGNPDLPASTPPSCTGCSLGGSCTQRSKRIEVTVTPVALWATPVIVTMVASPTQVGP